MNDRPLLSIVTPTLNQGRFIEATILSIKNQTYDHFEHLVVDGGSTDETLDILRRHEGSYPMRWLSEPDRGMYDAINKGMRLASGEILAYLNSDDLYFPWTLEAVVEAFDRYPEADVVFGDALGVVANGAEEIRFQPDIGYGYLVRTGSFVQPSVFWRRRVYERVGDFDVSMRLSADLDYWLRIGRHAGFLHLEEVLSVERDHADTKRARQWTNLLDEARTARAKVEGESRVPHRLAVVVWKFRAWAARRWLWARFAKASRSPDRGRPWKRFLSAYTISIAPKRFVIAQLPWMGRRVGAGMIRTGTDWGPADTAPPANAGPPSAPGKPPA